MGYCIRRFSASPCGTYWRDIRMIPVCFSATLCRPVKVTAMTDIPQVEQGETFSIGAGIGSYNGYQASATERAEESRKT